MHERKDRKLDTNWEKLKEGNNQDEKERMS